MITLQETYPVTIGTEGIDQASEVLGHEAKLGTEDFMTLAQASASLPGRPSISTVWRWARRGYGKYKVRLSYIRLGRRILISQADLEVFSARLVEMDEELPEPNPIINRKPPTRRRMPRLRTPEQRAIASAAARKRGGF